LFALLKAAGGHPEMENLKEAAQNGNLQYGRLKEIVADVLIELTGAFRERRIAIVEDQKNYQEKVFASSEIIRKKAQHTMREVKDLIGLMNPPV
jgi:tryptophanyl-tRNA synthetase